MPWYGWVLIGVGVVVLGTLKVVFGKKYLEKKRAQAEEKRKNLDRED